MAETTGDVMVIAASQLRIATARQKFPSLSSSAGQTTYWPFANRMATPLGTSGFSEKKLRRCKTSRDERP